MSTGKIKIELELTADTPDTMNFADTYEGFRDPWCSSADLPARVTMM